MRYFSLIWVFLDYLDLIQLQVQSIHLYIDKQTWYNYVLFINHLEIMILNSLQKIYNITNKQTNKQTNE